MSLHLLGINHQTAPVSLREKVAFTPETLAPALASLHALPEVSEVVLLSTCNRTEVYAQANGSDLPLIDWLATHPASGAPPGPELRNYLYRHRDADAVRHLFRVASGLDSLVLGEPQILGQVKQAWTAARAAGALGGSLDRLFQQAFATAKHARTDTRIGAHPVSVASTAVHLAQRNFARMEDSTVLLVGAGETIELAARHVAEARTKRLLIANRTLAHAQELASRHGGFALPLDELERHLAEADVVISATASRATILQRPQVERALQARRHRPMLLLDLAVPRDIDNSVGDLRDVFLYTIDDLEHVIEDNRRSRREAAEQAEVIIDLHAARFIEQLQASGRKQPLLHLRAHGEAARAEALAKARRQLAAGLPAEQALELLAHTLTNRLLHAPTVALREAALHGDAELARAAEKLFPDPASADTGLHAPPSDNAQDPGLPADPSPHA
ncbi:MAG: glutamyl-tRNA reductase [Thermomonas sp.]|uniref:glutamyl-tRNA reductase n=1 Tax=Thermomonas sp. TaxID=1971895 RepID=UPI001D36F3A3|nr:glutamyl-tRNA reductase [Thermomonas sp.]MBZ0088641.1 glutamyl-tRNA reductase [Thermomonas sp.]